VTDDDDDLWFNGGQDIDEMAIIGIAIITITVTIPFQHE
jgi:hypothetical protein